MQKYLTLEWSKTSHCYCSIAVLWRSFALVDN
nr:MAG TPA: hypothetical protein [Caudoviricetes sp.]